tara:strand:+ start:19634 stop:20299 length:666 start_codon:yes stop_codon:yes gene_type:complete
MYEYDLAVYGHITVDRIIRNFKEEISLGAIANFWNALNVIDTNVKYKLSPCAVGEAVVLINETSSQRFGRGNLNLKTTKPQIINAHWHHILYLNKLKDTSFIKNLNGKISADVTAGKMDIINEIKYIDYLFISEEDLFMDVKELAKLTRGHVILHYPSGSMCTDGEKQYSFTTEVKNNINVLGAGDAFAACFISNMLNVDDIEKSLENAHQQTLKVLTYEN